jgi:hypothetical protein
VDSQVKSQESEERKSERLATFISRIGASKSRLSLTSDSIVLKPFPFEFRNDCVIGAASQSKRGRVLQQIWFIGK